MSQLTKGQKRILVVLGLVLMYAVYDIASNWESYTAYYSNKPKKKAGQGKITTAEVNPEVKIKEDKSYLNDWKSDPFYMPLKKVSVKKTYTAPQIVLRLKAISYSGENSVAMINDKILKTGDTIGGYRIQKIEPKRVSLIKSGKVRVLSLQ